MSRPFLSPGIVSGGLPPTNPHSDPMITDFKGLSALPTGWANLGSPLTFDARGITADPTIQFVFPFLPHESIAAASPLTMMIAIDVDTWAAGTSGYFGLTNSVAELRFGKYSIDNTKVDSQFLRDSITADPTIRQPVSTGLYVASGTYDGAGNTTMRLFCPGGSIMSGTSTTGSASDESALFLLVNFAIIAGDVFYIANSAVWFNEARDNTELQAQAVSWGWTP